MKVNLSVTGVEEIDKVLKGLPLQLSDRVLQQAHAAAAKPLVDRAKMTAPEGPTGNLVDSIGVVKGSFNQVKSLQRDVGQVTVGPRRGKYKGNAAHLVEYGTKGRYTKGKGKRIGYKNAYRGVMPKKPFMEPSFVQTKSEVESRINVEIGRKLYSFMKRTLK